jgi:1-deoxy-D-xylulose 5-phosphate reductoisomerase
MEQKVKKFVSSEKKYCDLLNVVDDVLMSTKDGTEDDFFEEIPRLAKLVNEQTGQTLKQRFSITGEI